MTRLYVARKDNTGKLVEGSHPSCLAAWPTLYASLLPNESYDTRVYIGTYMTKAAAQVYMKGFRESYKDGIMFKRGDTNAYVPCPTLRYYDVDAKGLHSSSEFGSKLKGAGLTGYFVINISKKCTEREAYVWLKMFAKPVTYPDKGLNISDAFLKAYKALGNNWRAAVVALGLARYNRGYHFPLNGSVDLELARDWLKGGLHVTSAYFRGDAQFGSPLAGGHYRTHTTSAIVMPDLRTSNGRLTFHLSSSDTFGNAINQIKQLLGEN